MIDDPTSLSFDASELHARLNALSDSELDRLPYGVIGFDDDHVVRRYNAPESKMAGLAVEKVIGKPIFKLVAVCMNNFMVAQRFSDATGSGTLLDATIDYVLTFRMRPVKVRLRLLAAPGLAAYILVDRLGPPL